MNAERVKGAPNYKARVAAARQWQREQAERVEQSQRNPEERGTVGAMRYVPRRKRWEQAQRTSMGRAMIRAGLV